MIGRERSGKKNCPMTKRSVAKQSKSNLQMSLLSKNTVITRLEDLNSIPSVFAWIEEDSSSRMILEAIFFVVLSISLLKKLKALLPPCFGEKLFC